MKILGFMMFDYIVAIICGFIILIVVLILIDIYKSHKYVNSIKPGTKLLYTNITYNPFETDKTIYYIIEEVKDGWVKMKNIKNNTIIIKPISYLEYFGYKIVN